jgi:hypothetical protein
VFDAVSEEKCGHVQCISKFHFDTILDGVVTVRRMLGTSRGIMFKVCKCGLDIAWHGHVTSAVFVAPLACDAAVKCGVPINRYGFVVATEKVEEVIGFVFSHILNGKVINGEAEQYGTKSVAPKAWCMTNLIVSVLCQPIGEKFIGQYSYPDR